MDVKSKGPFVVDSSFVLSFLLPDEKSEKADSIFSKFWAGELDLVTIKLLPFEVLNGLKMAIIKKRIRRKRAVELAEAFLEIPFEILEVDWIKCLSLAFKNNLTVYDAAYLAVSRSYHLELLSLDSHLSSFSVIDN